MAVCNISEIDVKIVASKMRVNLDNQQINKVMSIYNHEEECDPNGNWSEIVEHCIYQVIE
jgi:hypothetical protein